jgi:hypothetical protein
MCTMMGDEVACYILKLKYRIKYANAKKTINKLGKDTVRKLISNNAQETTVFAKVSSG